MVGEQTKGLLAGATTRNSFLVTLWSRSSATAASEHKPPLEATSVTLPPLGLTPGGSTIGNNQGSQQSVSYGGLVGRSYGGRKNKCPTMDSRW
jgi:hypothetical protein